MRELEPVEIKEILVYKEILRVFNYVKFFAYLLNMVFVYLQKKEILNQTKESLLVGIDDNLSEALYNNIIGQCKNPDSESLPMEYSRILNESRSKSDSASQSQDFDRTNFNIQ